MQLPTYQPNALLNFEPISQGIDTYRQGQESVRRADVAKSAGNALMSGDYKGAMGTALAGDRADLAGLAMQAKSQASQEANHALDREHKMAMMYGGVAQQALQSKDPRVMQQTWTRMVASHPEFASKVQQFGVDPRDHAAGLNFVMAQAAGYRDPQDRALKQAQINNLNRREEPEIARTLKAFGIDPMSEEGRKIGLSKMGGEQPSSVREWNYYNNLPPEQKQEYLNMKRSEKYLDTGTSFVRPNPIDPSRPVASIAKDVKGEAQAKVVGRETGELQMGAPKALAALDAADAKSDVVGRTIAEAKAMVGQNTAGFGGAILKNMPGTAARDLAAKLDTLKANAGFGELQAMRDNSPTGGALGQVAVQELQMLQSTITSIEQAQTPAQLSKALDEFDKFTRESRVRRRKAYDATYGRVTGVEQAPAAPTGGGWSIKRID